MPKYVHLHLTKHTQNNVELLKKKHVGDVGVHIKMTNFIIWKISVLNIVSVDSVLYTINGTQYRLMLMHY